VADSGKSDQLAHSRHTKDRQVAEIKALIQVTEDLRSRLEKKTAPYGLRPDHQPTISHEGKWLLLDMGVHPARPIPGSEEAAARQAAAQNDYLAVTSPLSTSWWPRSKEEASETQQQMLEWRKAYDKAMERLQDYCARYGRSEVFGRFQRAGTDLGRHAELLLQELEDLDARESLLFRLERDLPGTLKAARAHPPEHTQADAAEEMNVDSETVGSWESGRRQPCDESQRAIRAYVLKRNGFPS
jgi:hypothetical protein